MDLDYKIRLILDGDRVNSFKSGDKLYAPLKSFLKNQAADFQRSHVAQTYVAVDSGDVVLGYVTLTCSEVDLRNGYSLDDCTRANDYDSLPAVKIARLAVDDRYRGKDIGENLIAMVLDIIINNISPSVGCRFIIADAKSEAVGFYQKQGFLLLDTEDNKKRSEPIVFFDLLPCFSVD